MRTMREVRLMKHPGEIGCNEDIFLLLSPTPCQSSLLHSIHEKRILHNKVTMFNLPFSLFFSSEIHPKSIQKSPNRRELTLLFLHQQEGVDTSSLYPPNYAIFPNRRELTLPTDYVSTRSMYALRKKSIRRCHYAS